ncbi:hypothetical protein PEC18_31075 [Paucibacter sp. O1-1]|nr:hypothetical protein [Paucibacter sp. O1-1]MDA3830148.1 hypothetical protein [Paucibacter sp. O1-1]
MQGIGQGLRGLFNAMASIRGRCGGAGGVGDLAAEHQRDDGAVSKRSTINTRSFKDLAEHGFSLILLLGQTR